MQAATAVTVSLRRLVPALVVLGLSLSLAACSFHASIHDLSELQPEEILLVGKIELAPALKEGEQTMNIISTSEDNDLHNAFYAFTVNEWTSVAPPTSFRYDLAQAGLGEQMSLATGNSDPSSPFYGTNTFRGFFGQVFFAPLQGASFYVRRINLLREQTSGSSGFGPFQTGRTDGTYIWAILPGGLQVKLKPGDKAVYVGTVRLHRDKNFDVSKLDVVDEYGAAVKAFNERFKNNTSLKLQKRLFTKVKGYKLGY